jgi:hypothetical protein
MGLDIFSFAEVRHGNTWKEPEPPTQDINFPLASRNYTIYNFLSGESYRNYPVPSLPNPYRGLPNDSEYLNNKPNNVHEAKYHKTKREAVEEDPQNSGFSWVTLAELLAFDYDQPSGHGRSMREELGEEFWKHIALLQTLGAPEDVRVVFWMC